VRESLWYCANCGKTWDEGDLAWWDNEIDECYRICPDCEYDLLEEIKPTMSSREIAEVRAEMISDQRRDDKAIGDLD
jgi:hypothetical protein